MSLTQVTCIHKVQGACEAIQCCSDFSSIKIQRIIIDMYIMCFKSPQKTLNQSTNIEMFFKIYK
jgi:hypothetical protein